MRTHVRLESRLKTVYVRRRTATRVGGVTTKKGTQVCATVAAGKGEKCPRSRGPADVGVPPLVLVTRTTVYAAVRRSYHLIIEGGFASRCVSIQYGFFDNSLISCEVDMKHD
ncbi:unnamed protein product [Arctia plantaginis]|uniref:Uncharacterized protein n=1 Tax=Arctia plantaginis TaxID=874455 RepID=A0A8S1B573_ARCPL|nr:unnamed protein product [Arctia plantaginis]